MTPTKETIVELRATEQGGIARIASIKRKLAAGSASLVSSEKWELGGTGPQTWQRQFRDSTLCLRLPSGATRGAKQGKTP
jgi:hypothetical protein